MSSHTAPWHVKLRHREAGWLPLLAMMGDHFNCTGNMENSLDAQGPLSCRQRGEFHCAPEKEMSLICHKILIASVVPGADDDIF